MRECRAAGCHQAYGRSVREAAADFLAALLIFLAVFALAAIDARPARPEPAFAATAPIGAPLQMVTATDALSPEQVTSGVLLARPAQASPTLPLAVIPSLGTSVEVAVSGPIARAAITQTFQNTGAVAVDGVYAFPLPERAAVDAVTVQIGKRFIRSEIRPRAKERQEKARARTGGPGAATPAGRRPTAFVNAIQRIGPGEAVTIRLEYQQPLRNRDGAYSLRVPLHSPPGDQTQLRGVNYIAHAGPDAKRPANPVTLKVSIEAGFPLGEVRSTSHAVTVARRGDEGATVSFPDASPAADKDFELIWRPKPDLAAPVARILREANTQADYLLAIITPPTLKSATAERPREVVFVVDISDSMEGDSLKQTRKSLVAAIGRLGERDRFNVIAFNAGFETLFTAPVEATAGNKTRAKDFVSRLEAHGGTRLTQPLIAALTDPTPDDTTRVRQIVLITDGAIANEQQLFSEIAVKRGRSRLFLIGIGPAPNSFLMRRAAEIGRGGFIHIESEKQLPEPMDRFLAGLEHPLATGLKIELPKAAQTDLWPDPLPDLYADRPLVISVRANGLKEPLALTGTFDGKPWSAKLAVADAKPGAGIGKLWARRKLASLEARRLFQPETASLDQEIEKVAMEHLLVSRMTGLVAVDRSPPRDDPAGSPMARNEPEAERRETWISGPAHHLAAPTAEARPHKRSLSLLGGQRLQRDKAAAPARATAEPPAPDEADQAAVLNRVLNPDRPAVTGPANADRNPVAADRVARNGTPVGQPGQLLVETGPGQPARPDLDISSIFWDRMPVVAIMALLFAAMSALTLGMWRHLQRLYAAPKRIRRAG